MNILKSSVNLQQVAIVYLFIYYYYIVFLFYQFCFCVLSHQHWVTKLDWEEAALHQQQAKLVLKKVSGKNFGVYKTFIFTALTSDKNKWCFTSDWPQVPP